MQEVEYKEWKQRNEEWLKSGIDVKSIACVFNILPDEFRKRIKTYQYDLSLNKCVRGGNYEVPLWYVTMAYDIVLKSGFDCSLITEEDVADYIEDYGCPPKRTVEKAIEQNNEMKAIWKEFLLIDVDAQQVNFEQFNMHMPPFISEEQSRDYFQDVIDGVTEWILCNVNDPSDEVCYDSVSCLMEYTTWMIETIANFFKDGSNRRDLIHDNVL